MLKIKTNNVPRDIVGAYELTPAERKEFDWIDWDAIDKGEDSHSFFRFRGQLYSLSEFMRIEQPGEELKGWDGISNDTYFSGVLVKLIPNGEQVVVGTFCS